MGEKSGGLTNMIIVLIALVVIAAVVKLGFPEIAQTIVDKFKEVIGTQGNFTGMIQLFTKNKIGM